MGPDEAVHVFRDLQAELFVPMHYGSFKLSFEDIEAPPRWLKEIVARDQPNSVSSGTIKTPGVARSPAATSKVTKVTPATIQA